MTHDVLALVRTSLKETELWQWLEPATRLRIITQPSAIDTPVPGHVQLVRVSDYDDSAQVELAARRAHRIRACTHLVSISEWDVLRAARLRDHLDLPGQRYASAAAFRDKALMKQLWSEHGVPTLAHARIEMPSDLVDFADRVGAVVVKPRRAAGSRGVAVLHDRRRVHAWLAQHWTIRSGDFSPWLAEPYVRGRMIQVDGLIEHGRMTLAWPTEIGSLLGWQHENATPVHAVMLDADDPLVDQTQDLVRRALAALPVPTFTAFHAEMWLTEHDGLLMNEVASRVGGAGTARMISRAFGINLHRRALRGAVYGEAGDAVPVRPHASAGFAMVPRRRGRVVRVDPRPAWLDPAWLPYCSIRVAEGEDSPPPLSSVDAAAHFVAVGDRGSQVAERLARATDWASKAIAYEQPAARSSATKGAP